MAVEQMGSSTKESGYEVSVTSAVRRWPVSVFFVALLLMGAAIGCGESEEGEDNDPEDPTSLMCERPDQDECAVLTEADADDAGELTLDESCYVVDGRFTLDDTTVTIDGGTTLYFEEEGGMEFTGDASLQAEGSVADPICLTGIAEESGHWRGLRFRYDEEDSPQNVLSHVVLEYAGSDPWGIRNRERDHGAIVMTDEETRLAIEESLIRHNSFVGINATHRRQGELSIAETVFEDNEEPLRIQGQLAGGLADSLEFKDNDQDLVALYSHGTVDHVIDRDTRWEGLPFRVDKRLEVEEGVLEVAPGADVQFPEHKGINVTSDGALSAVGDDEQPVQFRGTEEQRGWWRGLRFSGSSSEQNRLEHVVVEDAGSEPWTLRRTSRNEGGVVLVGEETQLDVVDSTFRRNDIVAIMAKDEPDTALTLESSTFEDNANATFIHAEQLPGISTDLHIEGNDVDAVGIHSVGQRVEVEHDNSWQAFDVPYRVHNTIRVYASVEIEPGVIMEFDEGEGLRVRGSLSAVGESDNPIVFRGSEPEAGHWRGLYFSSTWSDDNELIDVEVHDGGGHQWHAGRDSSRGNIVLAMSGSGSCGGEARVDVADALITNSEYHGIAIRHGSLVENCSNLEFADIGGHDVLYHATMADDPDYSGTGGCFCEALSDCLCED